MHTRSPVAQILLRFVEEPEEDRRPVIAEVKRLMEAGQSLDPQSEFRLALQSFVPELVDLTLQAGADANAAHPTTGVEPIFSFMVSLKNKKNSQTTHHLSGDELQDAVKILETLQKHGVDLDKRNKIGNNVLKLAITMPHEALSLAIIELGAGSKDDVALYNAAHQRMPRVVEALLKKGANPNAGLVDIKSPPIYTAVGSNDKSMLQMLFEHGADLHHTTPGGQLPLRMAIERGSLDAVDFILDKQPPDENQIKSIWLSAIGKMFFSQNSQEFSCMERLIERGFSPANIPGLPTRLSVETHDPFSLQFLAKHGLLDVHAKNEFGQTPLILSLLKPQVQSMNLLLSAGADPNVEIPGDPPFPILSLAAQKAIKDKGNSDTFMKMTAALISAGADINVTIHQNDGRKKPVTVAEALMRLDPQAKSNEKIARALQETQTLIRSIQAREVLRARIGAIVKP